MLVAVVGLVAALVRRRRVDLVLALFCVVYFADLLTLDAHFDRYVLPLVPPLAVLAGRVRALVPVALASLVVPLVWSIQDDADLRRADTREAAKAWIERHVPAGATVAVDPSTPPLLGYRLVRFELPGPGRETDRAARSRPPSRGGCRLRRRHRGGHRPRPRRARALSPRDAVLRVPRETRARGVPHRPGQGSRRPVGQRVPSLTA